MEFPPSKVRALLLLVHDAGFFSPKSSELIKVYEESLCYPFTFSGKEKQKCVTSSMRHFSALTEDYFASAAAEGTLRSDMMTLFPAAQPLIA